ncbi:MAG TPA: DUF1156 domain-containing protein [Ilumatobacter sp.]|nr:DUF1156 domain-containing protein [Ilumatobacter sp.]
MTYKKKLIEVALPLATINAESAREKSIRHGHPSTLHLWWARRPLAAARAVLWASLVDDPSAHPDKFPTEGDQQRERERLFDILERLVPWEASNDERILEEARAEILKSCDGDLPKVLDPFGGGGTIPLEALRLGLPTYSGDLNPVAVALQKAMLEVPQRFLNRKPVHPRPRAGQTLWEGLHGLAADVETYGHEIEQEVQKLVGQHYPPPPKETAEPIGWIWARAIRSPDPSFAGEVPLVGSWTIVNKPGKPTVWVEPYIDGGRVRYRIQTGGTPLPGTVQRGKGVCFATGAAISNEYIRQEASAGRLSSHLIAVVVNGNRKRVYLSPTDADEAAALVDDSACWRPSGSMSTHPQYMGTPRYGLDEWWKLFSPRQRATIDAFCSSIEHVRSEVQRHAQSAGMPVGEPLRNGGSGALAYAEAVSTYLSFVLDRAIARWNTVSIWNSVGEKIEHVFRLHNIQMTWAFVEANPFSSSTGGWSGQIEWVSKALLTLPRQAAIRSSNAQPSHELRSMTDMCCRRIHPITTMFRIRTSLTSTTSGCAEQLAIFGQMSSQRSLPQRQRSSSPTRSATVALLPRRPILSRG